jgi:hypothetical protein
VFFDKELHIPGVKGKIINITDRQKISLMNEGLE